MAIKHRPASSAKSSKSSKEAKPTKLAGSKPKVMNLADLNESLAQVGKKRPGTKKPTKLTGKKASKPQYEEEDDLEEDDLEEDDLEEDDLEEDDLEEDEDDLEEDDLEEEEEDYKQSRKKVQVEISPRDPVIRDLTKRLKDQESANAKLGRSNEKLLLQVKKLQEDQRASSSVIRKLTTSLSKLDRAVEKIKAKL